MAPKRSTQKGPALKRPPINLFFTDRTLFATPAGLLGWSNLVEPDQYQESDKPKFKAQWHFTRAALDLLAVKLTKTLTGLYDQRAVAQMAQEATAKLKKPVSEEQVREWWPMPDVKEWLEAKAKQPGEDDRIDLPRLVISRNAHLKNRKGETITAYPRVWDAQKNLLDLQSLRIGMGSTVQIIATPGMFVSPIAASGNKLVPTLRLEGLRVIKLEQYGNAGPQLGDLDEADLEVLEQEIEPDNLTAYMRNADRPTASHQKGGKPEGEIVDELPF